METWGRQCNGIVFVSNTTDSKLPVIIVHRNESWHTLWIKTREAFQWIYNNVLDRYDWFAKADDDTYYHMANLRLYLKDYSPDEASATGHLYEKPDSKVRYHSGGAGYVLSREAVRRLVAVGFATNTECQQKSAAEDIFIGKCLMKLNATLLNSADKDGRYRFLPIAMYDMFQLYRYPDWLNKTSVQKIMNVSNCCSPDFIAMNYAIADLQYQMHYMVHILRPFGVQYS